MPAYDCGDKDCDECQRAFGPDRSKAIANYEARERFYAHSISSEQGHGMQNRMALRDYIATHAINGLYAGRQGAVNARCGDLQADAEIAYRIADAMLRAREALSNDRS